MKKVSKKLSLNKSVITNLNGVKGGNAPFTQGETQCAGGTCICSLNPFECNHWSEQCPSSIGSGGSGGGSGNGPGNTTAPTPTVGCPSSLNAFACPEGPVEG